MSVLRKFVAQPKWLRVLVVVGTVGALVVTLLLLVTGEERARAPVQAREDMSGMAGMDGMNMNMSGDGVMLTAAQLREFGITFGTVEQRVLSQRVRATGVVAVDETRVTALAPKFSGIAERVYVGFTGAPVRAGQPMLEVYSPELIAAQEELLVAARMARTTGDNGLLIAARLRLRLLDISEAQIEQVLQSESSRRTMTLHARAGGVVVEKNVVAGQAFQNGELLYRIADLSTVWIEVELRESDAALARVGTIAQLEFPALPGRTLTGRVDYVYPTVEAQTRTVRARIRVANPALTLKPGMYATAQLEVPTRAALTVPVSALVRTGERDIVFVDMGNGRIMPHDVLVGRTTNENAEVLSGLEPGQRVVTSAQFLIDSESNLAEVMRSMIGQMGSGDMSNMKMPAPRR